MDFRNSAKDFFEVFEFNVIPLVNKTSKVSWQRWQNEEMTIEDIEKANWNSDTNGIGAISGIKKLRCLDFDKVTNVEIIEQFVRSLGLPINYQWIVKSGSHKGYHIWFYCDDDIYLNGFLGGEKSVYTFKLKEEGLCDHIELRWRRCYTVLPSSLHESGYRYKFKNLQEGLPSTKPQEVRVGKLIETLTEFCVLKNEKGEVKTEAKTKIQNRSVPMDGRYVREAAEFLKGKIDNYEDYYRLSFALASLGEEGRAYFLLIGKDNPRYPQETEAELNKKFDVNLKDYRGDVTLGTFFEIAKRYGFEFPKLNFWKIENGKVDISRNHFIEYLEAEGFGKTYLGKDYIFLQVNNNIVNETTPGRIKDYVFDYIDKINANVPVKQIKEILIRNAKTLFSESTLECMKVVNLNIIEETKDQATFYFNNCFVEVTRTEIIIKNYEKLDGFVWEKQLIKRDFSLTNENSVFEKFVKNVCRNNQSRINALISAIGYSLHSYKDPTRTKAIIFIDEKLSENAFGRSGKGLVTNAIKQLSNVLRIDGKNFRFDKSFPFQSVNLDTNIMWFDDVQKKFDFYKLFSILTEGITIEKKNLNEYTIPFERSPKILITTNHSITGNDDSSKARQFVIEFSDYYNAAYEPIHEFGKMFFKEWDEAEWNAFDNFMIGCCRYYLQNGLMEYEHVNLVRKKFIDGTTVEFEEFIKEIPLNEEQNKKELFERFKKEYEDFGQIKQNTFSKWTKVYANLYNLDIDERKSGLERYIAFREKEKKYPKMDEWTKVGRN
ncbi:MAG: bifunctional DNA primase/polymerase [Ignavibacteriaceae bacterium]